MHMAAINTVPPPGGKGWKSFISIIYLLKTQIDGVSMVFFRCFPLDNSNLFFKGWVMVTILLTKGIIVQVMQKSEVLVEFGQTGESGVLGCCSNAGVRSPHLTNGHPEEGQKKEENKRSHFPGKRGFPDKTLEQGHIGKRN